jgi:hypothetical protein
VGHTPQKGGRIRPRFGNKVFLIDTGMFSSYYHGGRASALEICGDTKFTAEYMDQQTVLLDLAGSGQQGGSPGEGAKPEDAKNAVAGLGIPAGGGICGMAPAASE